MLVIRKIFLQRQTIFHWFSVPWKFHARESKFHMKNFSRVKFCGWPKFFISQEWNFRPSKPRNPQNLVSLKYISWSKSYFSLFNAASFKFYSYSWIVHWYTSFGERLICCNRWLTLCGQILALGKFSDFGNFGPKSPN